MVVWKDGIKLGAAEIEGTSDEIEDSAYEILVVEEVGLAVDGIGVG